MCATRYPAGREGSGSGEHLTAIREEYLLILAESGSDGCILTELADKAGVSKPSACHIVKILEEQGYVVRDDSIRYRLKRILLTKKGRAYVKAKGFPLKDLQRWLMLRVGMDQEAAFAAGRRMVVNLDPKVVRAILEDWNQLPAEGKERKE